MFGHFFGLGGNQLVACFQPVFPVASMGAPVLEPKSVGTKSDLLIAGLGQIVSRLIHHGNLLSLMIFSWQSPKCVCVAERTNMPPRRAV